MASSKKFSFRNRTLIISAFLLVAALRLPAFRWPVISDDEGIYDAMAQSVIRGGVMYRDAVDHKPPGLTYLYAAAEAAVGAHNPGALGIGAVHFVGILLALLASFGLYLLAKEVLRPGLDWVPVALYGIVTTTKCAYDGLAVNGELLMNVPVVLAVFLVVRSSKRGGEGRPEGAVQARGVFGARRVISDLASGALVGVAGLAKWQALVVGLAFPFFSKCRPWGSSRSAFWRDGMTRGPFWLLGLALPFGTLGLYFQSQGVLAEAWRWGGLFNLSYIAEGPGFIWALQRFGLQAASVVLPSALIYGAGLLGIVRMAKARELGFVVWALVSILSVGIGGRFFGHYFLQAELPLCLLAAEPLSELFTRRPGWVLGALGIPMLAFLTLALMPGVTRGLFDPGDPDWERVAQAIDLRTDSEDTIFVWGNVPPLYHLAHRRMGSRFSFCNYLTGLSPGTPSEYDPAVRPDPSGGGAAASAAAWPLLMTDLEERRPKLIVDTSPAGWKGYGKFPIGRYPELRTYVDAHYRPNGSIFGAILYRRIH